MQMIVAKSKTSMRNATNQTKAFWELALPANSRKMITSTVADFLTTLCAWHFVSFISALFTKSQTLRRFSAFSAFLNWVTARFAKNFRILGFVRRFPARTTTTFAFERHARAWSIYQLIVMIHAKSFPKMWLGADGAFLARSMNQIVFTCISAQLKVIWSIVMAYFVLVMNFFFLRKQSTNLLFYYPSMLPNISSAICVWMGRHFDLHIAVVVDSLFANFNNRFSKHEGSM